MNKEFVPYEEALALKELGFDEDCFGFYHHNKGLCKMWAKWVRYDANRDCLAPLYQQAFRWFREKHGLFSNLEYSWRNMSVNWCIKFIEESKSFTSRSYNDYPEEVQSKTFEEAELSCLRKLIEIVKDEGEVH